MAQTLGTRTFFTQKSADGPTPGTGMFFTWQIAQTLLKLADGPNTRYMPAHVLIFSHGRRLKFQAHRWVYSLYMKMAQTPGTHIFTWKLADGPNTRCMHAHTYSSEISRWPKYQAHIFFIWRSADGPYTRHTHILHLEVASTKYNLSLSCSLSTVYYWVRIDNCRLHVDSIYWSFLEHAIIFTSMFPFLHTASSFITVFDWPQKWSKTILLCFSSIVMF